MDRYGHPVRAQRGRPRTGGGAVLLPAARRQFSPAHAPNRRMGSLRRRPVALVVSELFSPLRCARRLLPQASSPRLLASLPTLLHLGASGDLLSSGKLPAGKRRVALESPRESYPIRFARTSLAARQWMRPRFTSLGTAGRGLHVDFGPKLWASGSSGAAERVMRLVTRSYFFANQKESVHLRSHPVLADADK
jgi:hypothetical protein